MKKDDLTLLGAKRCAEVSTETGAVYYATLCARGGDANHKLELRLTDGERVLHSYSYFVPTQATDIYLPFIATGEERYVEVLPADGGVFFVGVPSVERSPYEYTKTKTGTYMRKSEEWQSVTVIADDERGLINGPVGADGIPNGRDRTLDCIVIGDYMYAICNGKLHTLRREGESFKRIGATAHLGELRQLAPTADGKGLIATARNYGLYSFDLSCPESPTVAAHIDSLEMATGLDVFGKYLYVADRTFGVDIIDISDIYNPVFVSNIPTGETQDVCYWGGYAYAGVWGECKVRICDVRDPDEPREVAEINLSGRGDGVFVKDGILFAATGQFALGEHKDRYNPGYGIANGLEIWDVSDPLSPKRLSVIRADGACYPHNPDLWRTYTSGKYLFFTSVYCGAYVYDVSDLTAPKRLLEYQVLSDSLPNTLWTETDILPHQKGVALEDNKKPFPIVDTYVCGDRIYLCTGMYNSGNNLYEARLPFYVGYPDGNSSRPDAQKPDYKRSYYSSNAELMAEYSARSYVTDSQIRAVAVCGDCLYLAAGARGIIVLDKATLKELASYPSFDITKDVKVKDGYLYTAESVAGVAVYKISDTDPSHLELVGQSAVANVVQLELSPDARYAVAHISNVAGLVDLRDKAAPKLYYLNREFHMVYQYQITIGCIADRYLAVSATKGKVQLYDFGEHGCFEEPRITLALDKTAVTGMCADGDRIFATSGHKIYLLDPEAITEKSPVFDREPDTVCRDMMGLPVAVGDYVFSTRRRSGEYSILRMSPDRKSAEAVKRLTFRANPGMTVFDGERYYLPLGYGGLISFKL